MKKLITYSLFTCLLVLFTLTDIFAGEVIFVGGGANVSVNDEYVTDPIFQDDLDNVNAVLNRYNELTVNDLPSPITLSKEVEAGDYGSSIVNRTYKDGETKEDEIIAGTLFFTPGTEYVSLKWDADKGGFGLWYVANVTSLDFPILTDFDVLTYGLSHYREWNSTENNTGHVPEPATMLLFGLGLLTLSGISRRKK